MSEVEFYTAEAEQVHASLDDVDVPREADGEKLSMSQRVALLTTAFAELVRYAAR